MQNETPRATSNQDDYSALRLRDIRGFADVTGLPVRRVYELVEMSCIPYRRVGRRVYFTQDDIAEGLRLLAQPARVAAR